MHIHCTCKRPNALSLRHGDAMIQCQNKERCVGGEWFHQACLGFNNSRWNDAREDEEWVCPICPAV
jgi:hypothetical protein